MWGIRSYVWATWTVLRTGKELTQDEVTERILAGMIMPGTPPRTVRLRDLPGLLAALAHVEMCVRVHARDLRRLDPAHSTVFLSRKAILSAMVELMRMPVGDGRELHELGLLGPYLSAIDGSRLELTGATVDDLERLKAAREALLSQPVPARRRAG
jgi:hypothetical protein